MVYPQKYLGKKFSSWNFNIQYLYKMTRKHQHHLNYENSLLKQKLQQLEYELHEINKSQSSKSNQHASTLIFLQNKNSELTKALLDKTKDVVKLQTQIHKHKQAQRMLYNGDELEDSVSISTEDSDERDVKPQISTTVPPMTITPQHIPPHPTKPKGWWHGHGHYHRPHHHHGWYGYPYLFDDEFGLYRDISGNVPPHTYHAPAPYHPSMPIHRAPQPQGPPHHPPLKPRSIGHFDNPFLFGEYDERDIVLPIKKPSHVIPPAKPHPWSWSSYLLKTTVRKE